MIKRKIAKNKATQAVNYDHLLCGVRFTDFMNASFKFRRQLTKYCISYDYEAKEARRVLGLLDEIDNKAENDEIFRAEFYKWLKYENGYSTIKLRELCKQVGCDYWAGLDESGMIDTFDSTSASNAT